MEIYCKNNGKTESFNPGITFTEIFSAMDINLRGCPMCVYANGIVKDMEAKVYEDCDVEFLDATTSTGARSCLLGLVFVLYKAISELYPGGRIKVSNAISKGFYCPVEIGRPLTDEDVTMISERMGCIIGRNIPFIKHTAHTSQVADILEKSGRKDNARLLRSIGTIYSSYYTLEICPTGSLAYCLPIQVALRCLDWSPWLAAYWYVCPIRTTLTSWSLWCARTRCLAYSRSIMTGCVFWDSQHWVS